MTELMSDEADCRTAPATPGLLKKGIIIIIIIIIINLIYLYKQYIKDLY